MAKNFLFRSSPNPVRIKTINKNFLQSENMSGFLRGVAMFIATGVGVVGGHILINSLMGGGRQSNPNQAQNMRPQNTNQSQQSQGGSGVDSLKNQKFFSSNNDEQGSR